MRKKSELAQAKGLRVFISSDIEGTAGVARWEDAEHREGSPWYGYFCRQMTREAAAACEGAFAAGASEILVKDAHGMGTNIDPAGLPVGVQINRGMSGGLFSMVSGLADHFDAVAFTGYHSPACGDGNPLAHTMALEVDELLINGQRASEFTIHSYVAAMVGVPVVFVSGDYELCLLAQQLVPAITTVPVSAGDGASSTSQHPDVAVATIRDAMEKALRSPVNKCLVRLPGHFSVRVRYRNHALAYRYSFFPGAEQVDERTIAFEQDDYYEVMRFFNFVL